MSETSRCTKFIPTWPHCIITLSRKILKWVSLFPPHFSNVHLSQLGWTIHYRGKSVMCKSGDHNIGSGRQLRFGGAHEYEHISKIFLQNYSEVMHFWGHFVAKTWVLLLQEHLHCTKCRYQLSFPWLSYLLSVALQISPALARIFAQGCIRSVLWSANACSLKGKQIISWPATRNLQIHR